MIRDPRWRRRAGSLFSAAVAACSTGEEQVPTGLTPIPSITISIDPTRATVAQGDSVAITAILTGSGGFTGAGATFALTGAPGGISFSVDKFETSGAITTATITASVTGLVSPGTYTIVVTGSGTGVEPVAASLELSVPTPSIAISIDPTSATVTQGGSVIVGARLTGSNGFRGTGAAFVLTGAPAGVTFGVSGSATYGSVTSATILISVATTVAPGTYTLELTGSGTGVRAVSASFELTVPQPSIAIRIDPASATVAQGGSVAIGGTLTGSGGFAGAGAAFTLTGAPAGISMEVSELRTGRSVTTATITTSVAATVPVGTYALDLTGSGTGVSPVSTPFALTVVAVAFTLSVNPATLDTCEGCGDVTATITISRLGGFAGSVLLSVSPPVGMEGSFTTGLSPLSTTGTSSTLTLSTNAGHGIYILTITGAAPGFATQTVPIEVTVW